MKKPAVKITVEQTEHLTADEKTMIQSIAMTGWYDSLEHFYAEATGWLGKSWLVYRGGSHVALHRTSGDDRRVLIAIAA